MAAIKFLFARGRNSLASSSAPRQIAELSLEIEMPPGLSPSQRTQLEEVGRKCPVARSIHPDVSLPMVFKYPD